MCERHPGYDGTYPPLWSCPACQGEYDARDISDLEGFASIGLYPGPRYEETSDAGSGEA